MVEAKNGGSECSGSYTDTGSCNTHNCPGTYKTYTLYQTKLLTIYVILISQLIANGVHGAIGTVARQAVDGAPKKDTDQYLFMLNMVEMDALAVTVIQNHVGRQVHVGREVGGAG